MYSKLQAFAAGKNDVFIPSPPRSGMARSEVDSASSCVIYGGVEKGREERMGYGM